MSQSHIQDRALRERAYAVIPNGMYGHLSAALLPASYPQYFRKAKGAHLWDVDGNRYLDFMCAYGPNLFGYCQPEVDSAYIAQLKEGDTMTGPGEPMVAFAEALVGQVSHADWAMFCKNGTDANTMALMVARNHTRRRTVLMAKGAYHGASPWSTPLLSGVTREDRAHQIFYEYNNVESLAAAVAAAGDDLAAIVASPFKHDVFVDQEEPTLAYAQAARSFCDASGALLIVDDVRAGFRLARDGSWAHLGVSPDLSSWGKAIANGHPVSALLGSDIARAAAATIYSTGSFWFASAALAAGVETMRLVRETDYLEKTHALGERLRAGLSAAAGAHGLALRQTGPAAMPLVLFEDDPYVARGYLWADAMLQRGIYVHPFHNMFLNAAMTEADIDEAIAAAGESFAIVAQAGELEPPPQVIALNEFVSGLSPL